LSVGCRSCYLSLAWMYLYVSLVGLWWFAS
jgi:hypothetical protein